MTCRHESFFNDDVCSGPKPDLGQQKRFHQENPLLYCPLPWGNFHPCPRCSLECRACWAKKEAAILSTYLESLPDGVHAYVGVLKVEADITVNDHRVIRRKFLEGITALAKARKDSIKIYVISEIDDSLRCHYHMAMTSTTEVTQHAVKAVWAKSCKGWPTIVFLEEMESRRACSKYAFKDLLSPGYVRLFKKKSLRLTWGHTGTRGSGFYPLGKDHYWRRYVEKNNAEKKKKEYR